MKKTHITSLAAILAFSTPSFAEEKAPNKAEAPKVHSIDLAMKELENGQTLDLRKLLKGKQLTENEKKALAAFPDHLKKFKVTIKDADNTLEMQRKIDQANKDKAACGDGRVYLGEPILIPSIPKGSNITAEQYLQFMELAAGKPLSQKQRTEFLKTYRESQAK